MATLMQQTNCIKTLANGGLKADSAEGQPLQASSSVLEHKRDLLPHELATLPASMINQHHPHQQQQQSQLHHQQFNNYGYYNHLQHHHQNNHPHLLHPHQTINSHVFVQSTTASGHTTTAAGSASLSNSTSQHQQIFSQHTTTHNSNTITSSELTQHANATTHAAKQHTTSSAADNNSYNMQNGGAGCSSSGALDRLGTGSPGGAMDTTHVASTDSNTPALNASDSIANTAAPPVGDDAEQEPEPEIDIVINNVVCSFSVRCHLNLREIALNGINVEFRRENGMVTMKLRRPYTTASIWSSGRITCTGATSEDQVSVSNIAKFSISFLNFV